MLRCTIAGLIPLLASNRFAAESAELAAQHEDELQDIMRHKSYYLLRRLPRPIAARLFRPALPALLENQGKDGLWSRSERLTYDILAAMKHIGAGETDGTLKRPRLPDLDGDVGFYSLLIKKDISGLLRDPDRAAIDTLLSTWKDTQRENGSWEDTVVGTVVRVEALLDLGLEPADEAVRRGTAFLFDQFSGDLPGIHTRDAYGLVGHDMFTTGDRFAEFESAQRLKPEWIPRHTCFRTLAIIQNSVCLTLLIRLGLEDDPRVAGALENLHRLLVTYGGLCATQIKKPFL